jgi:hypothetical protein
MKFGIFTAALAAIASIWRGNTERVAIARDDDFTISPPIPRGLFRPQSRGQSFYGATRGTRAAMKAARKRRRILAKLPK